METKSHGGCGWLASDSTSGPIKVSRCCATAKSTGEQCKLLAKTGRNFCGMHSGLYKPGQKKGAQPRLKHGKYSEETKRERKEAKVAISLIDRMIETINTDIQQNRKEFAQ